MSAVNDLDTYLKTIDKFINYNGEDYKYFYEDYYNRDESVILQGFDPLLAFLSRIEKRPNELKFTWGTIDPEPFIHLLSDIGVTDSCVIGTRYGKPGNLLIGTNITAETGERKPFSELYNIPCRGYFISNDKIKDIGYRDVYYSTINYHGDRDYFMMSICSNTKMSRPHWDYVYREYMQGKEQKFNDGFGKVLDKMLA